jgi:hypothetical protein
MKRILVTGSRDYPGTWEDIAVHLPEEPCVILHGACSRWRLGDRTYSYPVKGGVQCSVDMLADFAARGLGHHVDQYPVDERLDGPWPGAGPRRNERMLRTGKPGRGLAFGALWTNSGGFTRTTPRDKRPWKHTGTGGMVKLMLDAKLPVRWVASPGADPVDLTQLPPPPRMAG